MEPPFILHSSWQAVLSAELEKPYIHALARFLAQERNSGKTIYPPEELVLNAFSLTPYESVSVVIVGQDPYHGPGQAHGLCFSVQPKVKIPPSLQNIFQEISNDIGSIDVKNGCLTSWARQGVLLLNAILTVEKGMPASHHNKGWEKFTDEVLRKLNDRETPLVFLLWGKYAQEKGVFIDSKRHLVLQSSHPSPFSARRGFLGCKHFSKANLFLTHHGLTPVDWLNKDP